MRTCSIHRWRWVCIDDLCWNASMDASRWCHRSSYPRTMTRLRGKFLLARACNSSTSRFLSELIFPLFSSDFFFMIRRVDPMSPSRLVMLLDLSMFAAHFEPSLASLPSFRKRSPTILSSVWFWVKVIVVHDRAIDHWIYAESWNARRLRSLFLPPLVLPPPSFHV